MLNSEPDRIEWYRDNDFILVDGHNNTMFLDLLETLAARIVY
jgi:hypothetical protein